MRNLTKSILGAGTCMAIVATAVFADSHVSPTKAIVDARHAQMQLISYHTGILGAIAKGEMEYDSAIVDAAASNIREMAKLQRATIWVEGTEQGVAADSRAKAEVWSDPDGFSQKFTDLENASSAMVGAADMAAVGAGMAGIGGACKACHDDYRGPKN
ncbi:MAG: cytochrome c [Sulfitobacter sp.]